MRGLASAGACEWAREFDPDFYARLTRDPDYSRAILGIGRGGPKPRRDYAFWRELPDYMSFFFDETFAPGADYPENLTKDDLRAIFRGLSRGRPTTRRTTPGLV